MEKSFTVYKHTAPNSKVYIGITCQPLHRRWRDGDGYKDNYHFYNAIQKYGWDNIKHEVIAEGLTKEAAYALEIEQIASHNSTDQRYGYNHTQGGDGGTWHKGRKRTAETCRKISEALKRVCADTDSRMICNQVKRRVRCVENNTVYESETAAAKAHGASQGTISLICHHKRKALHRTYHFEYV